MAGVCQPVQVWTNSRGTGTDTQDATLTIPVPLSSMTGRRTKRRKRPVPPFQHPSTSYADVQSLIHHELVLRRSLLYPFATAIPHTAVQRPKNPWRIIFALRPLHKSVIGRQTVSQRGVPPSILPESLPDMATTRGCTRNHTQPMTAVPLPIRPHQTQPQSHWQRQQVTPPPTPPAFDARGASARLRTIDGYVSSAKVEGLGRPPYLGGRVCTLFNL
ncbi:hypothetical protein F5148DRAFT_880028 [Russula earlei]|uniref:Uncharacterized protein n=2 Tax=Russula earlei TaxID=71964 RepID=A0ACC0TVH3_9AGAM|nr:hypothetical protein F5148DRAFT_629309 [Russula earlei]KAI9508566.1 hypothetical protein F5148DRAFT_880028 [Russula earlei]